MAPSRPMTIQPKKKRGLLFRLCRAALVLLLLLVALIYFVYLLPSAVHFPQPQSMHHDNLRADTGPRKPRN